LFDWAFENGLQNTYLKYVFKIRILDETVINPYNPISLQEDLDMKKTKIFLGSSIGIVSLIVILPGAIVQADPNGSFGGQNGIDDWFSASWTISNLRNADNAPSNQWRAGVQMGGIIYRDYSIQPPGSDNYDPYAAEVFIPWVRITYNNNNVLTEVIYPHDTYSTEGGTDDGHIMITSNTTVAGNNGTAPAGDSYIAAEFQLDVDSSGTPDYTFLEQIVLHGRSAGGWIEMDFAMTWSRGWNQWYAGLGNPVKIEVAYVCDAEVTNPTDYAEENIGGWTQIDYEDGPVNVGAGGAGCVRVTDSSYDHDLTMVPANDGHSSGEYWVLNSGDGTEITQYPDSYQDGENVDYTSITLWYVESFTQNSPPRTGPAGNGWDSVRYDGLEE
jgi:hypothetical protein